MRAIIHHVHKQPEHIRQLVAGVCTVVVGGLAIVFWFNSFQDTSYALLNPGQETSESPALAESQDSESLFSSIGSALGNIKAQISGLSSGRSSIQTETEVQTRPAGPAYPLPVSGDR